MRVQSSTESEPLNSLKAVIGEILCVAEMTLAGLPDTSVVGLEVNTLYTAGNSINSFVKDKWSQVFLSGVQIRKTIAKSIW